MLAGETFSPDSLIPFSTYRTARDDGKGYVWGAPELCGTLAHFYFSERLRGVDEQLRREILLLPSASEARKAAQRLEASPKWTEVRLDIVKAALWCQFLALPSLASNLLAGEVAIGDGQSLGHGWEARRRGDERWKQVVQKTAQQFVSPGRMVLLATGDTDIYNPFLFSSRLAVLLAGKLPKEMLIACRSGVDAMAEDWAIENHIPAVHHPLRKAPGTPVTEASIQALASAATHAIIFTKGQDSSIIQLRQHLAHRQIPTRVVLLDKDGRPVPKQTPPSRGRSRS